MYGIEIDGISGRIARQLYQKNIIFLRRTNYEYIGNGSIKNRITFTRYSEYLVFLWKKWYK